MARRHDRARTSGERDEAADQQQARDLMMRLAALLRRVDHPRTKEADGLLSAFDEDPAAAWRQLDGNAWWAGAGSLAAESLVEPQSLPEAERATAMQEFRAILIDLAELLRARGPTNPGLSSWLLAFRNWDASGV
jgi:hypothetical protein